MNKTLAIIKNEFRKTVKRGGFIFLTAILPVLGLLFIGVSQIVSNVTKPPAETVKIGYVDELGGFTRYLQQGNFIFESFGDEAAAKQALLDGGVSQYIVIPPDLVSKGVIARYTLNRELEAPPAVMSAVQSFATGNLLAEKVPADVIARIESSVGLQTTQLEKSGEPAPSRGGYANFIVPAIFSFFLLLALVFSSTYLLQSLSEEKENRVLEILVSSVSTRQLLVGKVLGLGAAGLLQVLVWVVTLPILLGAASSSFGGILSGAQVPASFWLLGVIYFVLGYLVFAVLSASVAAITSTMQEAQGFSSIYTLMAVVPLWTLSVMLISPDSPAWVALSIFPFTAPVEVMLRLGLTGVPFWQLALSLTVLAMSVAGGLALASRLLRTYMLTYGKRPGFTQIFRSLRSS
jgi:ABC-2 type transport system permease protein